MGITADLSQELNDKSDFVGGKGRAHTKYYSRTVRDFVSTSHTNLLNGLHKCVEGELEGGCGKKKELKIPNISPWTHHSLVLLSLFIHLWIIFGENCDFVLELQSTALKIPFDF